jgi:DNA polymerase (family 10)
MSNKEIAYAFDELANLMELHEEDEFRIRSYRNAYIALRKVDQPLVDMSDAEIRNIKGVGNAIAGKIHELLQNGKMVNLEKYKAQTPPGIVEMLDVNGFGPKKVRTVWKDMGIESIGELWYACHENRLVEFKGFGLKTQEDLKSRLTYYLKSRDQLHYDTAEEEADFAISRLQGRLPGARIEAVGAVRRRCPVVDKIEILVGYDGDLTHAFDGEALTLEEQNGDIYQARLENKTPITVYRCAPAAFGSKQFKYTGVTAFLEAFVKATPGLDYKDLEQEATIFEKAGLPYIAPELRENAAVVELARQQALPALITDQDIKGILHVHTTWSDVLHTLRDMCSYAKQLGYAYIGITDHSQSAFYANGLKPDRILAQMAEIDALNVELAPFRIFKGVESDILNDGSLDYEEDLLGQFDFIIASVHSNLKMAKDKATERVVRAIRNPRTTILGHPTGRLLLSREGYPLDWDQIFDACVEHGVAIELNANPYRLDSDYTLIPEAIRRGIPISINPDAHSRDGYNDIRYGVLAARKGGLTASSCLNTRNLEDFTKHLNGRK